MTTETEAIKNGPKDMKCHCNSLGMAAYSLLQSFIKFVNHVLLYSFAQRKASSLLMLQYLKIFSILTFLVVMRQIFSFYLWQIQNSQFNSICESCIHKFRVYILEL